MAAMKSLAIILLRGDGVDDQDDGRDRVTTPPMAIMAVAKPSS
jgi:hypothetical protein